ncbi:hypothetical protein GQ457_07G014950 [Hibiscus cannabinus]
MASKGVLLYRGDEHISSHIDDEQIDEQRIRRRGQKIKEPSNYIEYYLQVVGFYNASFLRGYKIVPALIVSLIERWRPKTHTFHFPFGECTITLEDVVVQLGVPINGRVLVGHNKYNVYQLCMEYLGKIPPNSCVDGLRVRISWLQNEFIVTEGSTRQKLIFATRAYILQLIGGVLMPDTSGNLVHTQYLPLMANLNTTSEYSWGSAILTCLYHELYRASIMNGQKRPSDMGGCQILMQSWAWYKLPYLTPIVEVQVPMEFPLAGRWRHKLRNAGVVHNNVRDIRVLIQTIGKDQPYANPTIMVCIPESVLQCRTFWGAVVPLIHFGVVEYQCGDRIDENWTVKQANLISVWEERHTRWAEDLSPLQESDFEFNTEYYSWYLENGKPFLISVEAGNKWREDPRCSKHRQLTSEFGPSFEEPTDDPYDEPNFDRSRGWPSSWDSVEEQPSFGNVWNSVEEQPSFGNVWNSMEEQPPMYGGGSSSQPAYTDDGGYIPQMDYTSITGLSYHPEQMHGTPPSMQVDDQWFNDE